MAPVCQCCDRGCPIHSGKSACDKKASTVAVRIDMDNGTGMDTGMPMCEGCATDAMESGVFSLRPWLLMHHRKAVV